MPTQLEVAAASPLTATGAVLLGAYLRACAFYLAYAGVFKTLGVTLGAHVGAATDDSRLLASILTALDAVGDGTVAVKGGRFGADYSKSRDREQLCVLALSVLYNFAALGIVVGDDGQGIAWSKRQRGGDTSEISIVLPGEWS